MATFRPLESPPAPPARPAVGETPPPWPRRSRLGNGRIAVVMLIVTLIMLFSGLIGAFLVLRTSAMWSAVGQPRLPIAVTAANTVGLLLSAMTMAMALRAHRRGEEPGMLRLLGVTAVLGTTFVAVQGVEWLRLLRHGLTLSSSNFGATFYLIIGLHAAHVVAAVLWLLAVMVLANRGRYRDPRHEGVEMCAIYWYFVCAIWPVLFVLVYLS